MQPFDLLHHRIVDREAAGSIDDEYVVIVLAGIIQRGNGNVFGLLGRSRGEDVHSDLARQGRELFDCGGPVHVATDEQYFFLLLLKKLRQFSGRGRLARTLQASHEDDCRRNCRKI